MPLRSLVLILGLLCPMAKGGGQTLPLPADTTGVIRGRIFGRQGSHLTTLAHAVVTVSSGLRHQTVLADSSGDYTVRGIGPGAWSLHVLHVGYDQLATQVRVPPGGSVTLDLELHGRPISLPSLMVLADPVHGLTAREPAPPSEMGEVALRALEGSVGIAEGGLSEVVRSLPGSDPAEPRDVLLMRGSATDLKLVLLDGAPVYTPFHMAGLVESFDPQTLGGASLFLGGAPARFDGGLSYILDLQPRRPRTDGIHGMAALDLLTGNAVVDGPLTPSTGFLVGSRVVHDLGTPLLAGGASPYGYGDMLARVEWARDGTGGAWLTGFWNRESVFLDLLPDVRRDLPATREQESRTEGRGLLPGNGAEWGNRAVSGGVRGTFHGTRAELRAAASRYRAELPIGDSIPLFAQSRSDRFRATADLSRPWGEGSLRFGGSLERQISTYSAITLDSAAAPVFTRADLEGLSGGVYLEASRLLTPALRLQAGIRGDRYRGEPNLRLAPRVSLTWMLTDNAALTLAAGRYHQYSHLASGDVEQTLGERTSSPAAGSPPLQLSVASASHFVVALDQLLLPGLRLGLQGFVKEFSGLMGSGTDARQLSASGFDLRVAREGERASGWLGYTLTWFWASSYSQVPGSTPFSGRHLLSAGFTSKLTDRTGVRLRGSYGDGLPYTSVPLDVLDGPASVARPGLVGIGDEVLNAAPELTAGPDEGFLRVEVELYGRWSPTIRGRTMELRPYLRVLNALNRRDALFYQFDPWRGEGPEPLAELPVLPLLGLEWRF